LGEDSIDQYSVISSQQYSYQMYDVNLYQPQQVETLAAECQIYNYNENSTNQFDSSNVDRNQEINFSSDNTLTQARLGTDQNHEMSQELDTYYDNTAVDLSTPQQPFSSPPTLINYSECSNYKINQYMTEEAKALWHLIEDLDNNGSENDNLDSSLNPKSLKKRLTERHEKQLEELTIEDQNTLKRLNEIAKSPGLSQEQKSTEAIQLLKNNRSVSNILLKMRSNPGLNWRNIFQSLNHFQ